jgi:hypothetical protein
MTKKLLFPEQIREQLLRRYNNQHKTWLMGEGAWPLEMSLGIPTEQDAASDPITVRKWVEAWHSWNVAGDVAWGTRQWGRLGTHKFPAAITWHSPQLVATALGLAKRWDQVETRYRDLISKWPQLAGQGVLGRHFNLLAEYPTEDFGRLLAMLSWLDTNPASRLSPRQLPVEGLDTKWLERRKGVITDLFRQIRGNGEAGDFYEVCGLRRAPHRLRMRVLCPNLRRHIGGLTDIEAPVGELADLRLEPQTVLVVENLETGLALPDVEGAVAFMRLGNAVTSLGSLGWLQGCRMLYWGDLDTHGFAILNRARQVFPNTVSILMDEDTLLAHRPLWGEEPMQCPESELRYLTAEEQKVFSGLKNNRFGVRLRLEQERIPWDKCMESILNQLQAHV